MRIAMVSEHASPLAVLGGVDAGGQNVHVAALAAALGRMGDEVVVHTRRDAVATFARDPDRARAAGAAARRAALARYNLGRFLSDWDTLIADPEEARERGEAARTAVLERYGLERFLADWDDVLEEVTAR